MNGTLIIEDVNRAKAIGVDLHVSEAADRATDKLPWWWPEYVAQPVTQPVPRPPTLINASGVSLEQAVDESTDASGEISCYECKTPIGRDANGRRRFGIFHPDCREKYYGRGNAW